MHLTTALWETFILEASCLIFGHKDCLRMPVPLCGSMRCRLLATKSVLARFGCRLLDCSASLMVVM